VFQFGADFSSRLVGLRKYELPTTQVDLAVLTLNNPCMPRPEVLRRVKSYSAATGYVYQYYFYEVEKARRGKSDGTEYIYMISVDRKSVFPLKVFVAKDALEKWSASRGQQLTGTEEYAVAKMCLFQAFDEIEELTTKTPDLVVDEKNLDALLSQLDL
jgi:hypothetical protein